MYILHYRQTCGQGLILKDQDQDQDWTLKDQDQDQDWTSKDQDQDQDWTFKDQDQDPKSKKIWSLVKEIYILVHVQGVQKNYNRSKIFNISVFY